MSAPIKIHATLSDGSHVSVEASNIEQAKELLECGIAAIRREGKKPEHRCGQKPTLHERATTLEIETAKIRHRRLMEQVRLPIPNVS